MFESLKQNDGGDGMRYASSLLVSITVHGTLIGLLIFVPLLFCDALHPDAAVTFLLGPPSLPERPVPPTPPVNASGGLREITVEDCGNCAPPAIPPGIPLPDEWPDSGMSQGLPFSTGLAGIGIAPVPMGPRVNLEDLIASATPLIPPPPKRPIPKEPVMVGMLQESKLIVRVDPVYPPLAIKTHTSGTVTLEAVVNEEGTVTRLKVVSGHPLLVDAALAAVWQWKYTPTILNGDVVPVVALIRVTFQIR